jgi:hypothetical protein
MGASAWPGTREFIEKNVLWSPSESTRKLPQRCRDNDWDKMPADVTRAGTRLMASSWRGGQSTDQRVDDPYLDIESKAERPPLDQDRCLLPRLSMTPP